MKLEKQVVSLELAKKLRELGVEQLSFFYHVSYFVLGEIELGIYSQDKIETAKNAGWKFEPIASAFTVAELGEMIKGYELPHRMFNSQNEWLWVSEDAKDTMIHANTEADARAKMLIYLIENKYPCPLP